MFGGIQERYPDAPRRRGIPVWDGEILAESFGRAKNRAHFAVGEHHVAVCGCGTRPMVLRNAHRDELSRSWAAESYLPAARRRASSSRIGNVISSSNQAHCPLGLTSRKT